MRKCLSRKADGVFRSDSCLIRLERYDEAEPLLLGSYSVIEATPDERSRSAQVVREAIVELYARWGRAEQAAEWRARLPPDQPGSGPAGQPADRGGRSQ